MCQGRMLGGLAAQRVWGTPLEAQGPVPTAPGLQLPPRGAQTLCGCSSSLAWLCPSSGSCPTGLGPDCSTSQTPGTFPAPLWEG